MMCLRRLAATPMIKPASSTSEQCAQFACNRPNHWAARLEVHRKLQVVVAIFCLYGKFLSCMHGHAYATCTLPAGRKRSVAHARATCPSHAALPGPARRPRLGLASAPAQLALSRAICQANRFASHGFPPPGSTIYVDVTHAHSLPKGTML